MSELLIRKSGGANIVSLPKSILDSLGLSVGSTLNLSVKDRKIVLSPVSRELTSESLLAGSPKDRLKPLVEDNAWLNALPAGKELL